MNWMMRAAALAVGLLLCSEPVFAAEAATNPTVN